MTQSKDFNVETRLMSAEEWIKIADNPVQRDTARHAGVAINKHLKTLQPTHLNVAMAEQSKTRRWKLDGHTRGYLWEQNKLEMPSHVIVTVYKVKSKQEAIELYDHFDNQDAVETAGDKLSGAFRLFGIPSESKIWNKGGVTTALKVIWGGRKKGFSKLDIVECVRPWIEALTIVDSLQIHHPHFPAPIFSALLISVARDGREALSFWEGYKDNLGRKFKDGYDMIELFHLAVRRYREDDMFSRGSYKSVTEVTPTLLNIYDKWSQGRKKMKHIPYSKNTLQQQIEYFVPEIKAEIEQARAQMTKEDSLLKEKAA